MSRRDGRAAAHLGERAQVGLVGHGHGYLEAERREQPLAERHIDPAKVRRQGQETVAPPDRGDDGHADGEWPCHGRPTLSEHLVGQSAQVADHLVDLEVAARTLQPHLFHDPAAEADEGRGQ